MNPAKNLPICEGIETTARAKHLLEIARQALQAEREVDLEVEQRSAKTALTELLFATHADQTPAIVERIVNDDDESVRVVRCSLQPIPGNGREKSRSAWSGIIVPPRDYQSAGIPRRWRRSEKWRLAKCLGATARRLGISLRQISYA